ncbi:MAG: two-component system response regulator [Ferruginibacter sp.]|uniref:response regulator n=1 Tax=Ferruginibacter sp. TaxID=1940288 RepID=UPI00265B662F|nr:response regulator [Ferruginibacter sp.]MDB5280799.1 two-component system response regulator [Ferruginibacter sp.]
MITEVDILLVEDNASDAEMTIDALKSNGLANKLKHVKDGAAALDFIFAEGEYVGRNIENRPKIILLDVKMPRVNGIEVLHKIRNDDRTKNIPVVMLTSSKEDPDIKTCYELGVNSYVVKPVEFEEFQKAITALGLYWMIVNQQPK